MQLARSADHETLTVTIETEKEPAIAKHRSPPPHLLHNAMYTKPDPSRAGRTDIYRTYPEIEHAAPKNMEVIKERVVEKEVDFKPPQIASQPSGIDANRLADQIYQLIERRVRIERERRGL
ncbi:MAG: hypothetical protein U9Q68_04650 [Euryarchaeota archaeon]|nr:hypothetical protein [Euryarchaeota archaeon]